MRPCEIEGCPRPHKAKGYCITHYRQWRKTGDPVPPSLTTEERFWAKVDRSGGPDACWEWQAATVGGYGRFRLTDQRKTVLAHRLAWELTHGQPAAAGMFLCHRCDNPPCCNPAHLFEGTDLDNKRDMLRKGRAAHQRMTHCIRGHEFTPENTRYKPSRPTYRICIACEKARAA